MGITWLGSLSNVQHSFVKGAVDGHVRNSGTVIVGRSVLNEEFPSVVSLQGVMGTFPDLVA
jgi:hypothetical protein